MDADNGGNYESMNNATRDMKEKKKKNCYEGECGPAARV